MESESIDCVVTSPPYWNLRDYGVPEQIGFERTIGAYLVKLWVVFAEVRRVLKKSGTCWIVMGDTYDDKKNLCMIPEKFAIGMTDGRNWTLRSKIIWHKPNAMPSSIKDRFMIDWEYLFFFVKWPKYYFEMQYEPMLNAKGPPIGGPKHKGITDTYSGNAWTPNNNGRFKRSVWKIAPNSTGVSNHFAVYPEKLIETPILAGCPYGGTVLDPFVGSGTTGVVALKHGRKFVGIELNPEYVKLANTRLGDGLRQTKIESSPTSLA